LEPLLVVEGCRVRCEPCSVHPITPNLLEHSALGATAPTDRKGALEDPEGYWNPEDSRGQIYKLQGAHRPHRAPTTLFLPCISSRRLWKNSRASYSL